MIKKIIRLRKLLSKAITAYFEQKDKEISYQVYQMSHIFSLFIFQRNKNVKVYNIRTKMKKPMEDTIFSP